MHSSLVTFIPYSEIRAFQAWEDKKEKWFFGNINYSGKNYVTKCIFPPPFLNNNNNKKKYR